MSGSALPSGIEFRMMHPGDVREVLAIIAEHDDDDYEEAHEVLNESLEGHYVLTFHGRVVGSTGAQPVEDADNTWWLMWSYLASDHHGTGLMAVMVVKMLDELRRQNARKVFVQTSDYMDLDRGNIYRDTLKAYERLGFVEELRHPNYYERNIASITLGLRLAPPPTQQLAHEPDMRPALIVDVDEIPEAEDAYFLEWELTDGEGSTTEDIEEAFRQVAKWRGRVVFASCPSDVTRLASLLRLSRFAEEGRLTDYFADGIDEIHFRYDLK